MLTNKLIDEAEKDLLHVYNRYQIVLEKGDGVYLYDVEGKKYLDFASGIAVFALGYHYKDLDEAIKGQVDKLIHTSNLFYNKPAIDTAKKLKKITGMDRVFFTNSGTEAIEGAIKLARKYAYNKDGHTDHEIIAMQHSFHGRSLGALSVTGNVKYQEPFKPLIGGVKFANYNDLESVKSQITDKTCAIILETLQGEGGIYPAKAEFLQGIRKLCDEKDILLILDEIQCGMGRTGTMFCFSQYGIEPDILTVAKALGCGMPIGAVLCKEFSASMTPGDHGSTYGGNPLVCAAASKVLDIFEQDDITSNVKEAGAYLTEKLQQLVEKYDVVKECRGKGLMQGLEFTVPVGDIIKDCLNDGLILISAGANIIRFVPPLIITKENIDEMTEILEKNIK